MSRWGARRLRQDLHDRHPSGGSRAEDSVRSHSDEARERARAHRTRIAASQKRTLVKNGDGAVSFRSHQEKHLVAEADGRASAIRAGIGSWGNWRVIGHRDGTVFFRSRHGKYLAAALLQNVLPARSIPQSAQSGRIEPAEVDPMTAIQASPSGSAHCKGVDTRVRRSEAHPTEHCFVTHGEDGHHFDHHRAGSAASRLGRRDLPAEVLGRAAVFHASAISRAIGPGPREAVSALMATAPERGVLLSYDASLRVAPYPPGRREAADALNALPPPVGRRLTAPSAPDLLRARTTEAEISFARIEEQISRCAGLDSRTCAGLWPVSCPLLRQLCVQI